MSRSDPHRSSIVRRLRENSGQTPSSAAIAPARGRKLSIRFAKLMRWLHIYLSMFGLAAVLFYSVTGITLNHPDFVFGQVERRREATGQLDLRWVGRNGDDSTSPLAATKLDVVEYLRKTHSLRGALVDFRVDDGECTVSFKGPAYSADAFVNRETGQYTLTEIDHGLIALLNDLHKGRDTGAVWSAVIDVSAGLMTIISLTGLVLLFYLKLKRVPGVVVALVGTVVLFALFRFWVP